MAHSHDSHAHRDVEVVEGSGFGAGMMIGAATILVVAVLAIVLLVAQPWDDDANVTPNVPDVTDDSGGGGGGTDGGTSDGGGTGGSDAGGGTDGGVEPPAP
ncbi:MAG: hypothetical protein WD359_00885 [Dehalococcoidia bacterium]